MEVMVMMAQKSVSTVMQQPVSSMMQTAEVMHVAEMASCPVRGIEMMSDAAGRKVASAERMRRHVRHAGVRVAAGMRRHHMANDRVAHRSVTDRPTNDSCVTAAEVRPTTDVPCAPRVSATNMAAPDMPTAVTNMSSVPSARVTAGMSAPAVPVSASMSSAMLREKWICQENADARAQQDGEPDCRSLFPSARKHPGWHAGLHLHT